MWVKGLDLNSGWNWTPINHGWFLSSIISGSLLSGDKPENINPFSQIFLYMKYPLHIYVYVFL